MGDRRTVCTDGTTRNPGGASSSYCSLPGSSGEKTGGWRQGSSAGSYNTGRFPPPGRRHKQQRVRPYQLKDGILLGFLLVTASCVCISTLVLLSSSQLPSNLLQLIKRHLPRLSSTRRGSSLGTSSVAGGGGVGYRGGLYVGVVTSGRTLERAEAVRTTWGAGVSNLTFFADQQSMAAVGVQDGMNIVRMPMPLVSPFKLVAVEMKTFHALTHVCTFPDADLQRFDWFFMSRDDVYVNVRNMAAMIRTLDPMKKVQAGLTSKGIKDGPSVCMSTPGLLLSRRLLQDVCDYLERCQQDRSQAGANLRLSSCIYKQSAVPCTQLPQEHFHKISDDEIKSLVLGEAGHVTEVGQRLDHVVATWSVPQPWLILQLHTLSLLSRLKDRGQVLKSQMETKRNMESYLYTSYSGSTLGSSIRADDVSTREGLYYSSHSCGGVSTGHSPNHTQLIESAAYILQASNTEVPERTFNFTFHQIYSANIGNRTMASLVDLAVSSADDAAPDAAPGSPRRELARVSMAMRHQPVRQTSQKTFNKISQLWILLPVSHIPKLASFLEFWRELRQVKLGFAVNLLVLPVGLSGVQLFNAIPKEGIYSPSGELRRLIPSPKEYSSVSQAYSDGVGHVCYNGHQDSAILMMSPDFRFRPDFLKRCLALSSAGSHYIPIPYTNSTFYQNTWSETEDVSMETGVGSHRDRNHVVWMDRQPTLKCLPSIGCKDPILNKRTFTSQDPDIYWYNTSE